MMLDNRSFDALDFKPIKPLIGVKLLRLFSSLANCTLLGAEPCFDGIELVGAVLYLRGKRQDLALELHTQEDEPDKLFVSLAKIEKNAEWIPDSSKLPFHT